MSKRQQQLQSRYSLLHIVHGTHLLAGASVVDDDVGQGHDAGIFQSLVQLNQLLLIAVLGGQVVQLALHIIDVTSSGGRLWHGVAAWRNRCWTGLLTNGSNTRCPPHSPACSPEATPVMQRVAAARRV